MQPIAENVCSSKFTFTIILTIIIQFLEKQKGDYHTWAPPVLGFHPVFVAFTLLLQTYVTRRDEIVDIAIHVAPKIISLGLRVTMKFPKQTVLNPVSPVIVSTTIPKRTEVGIGCI